METSIPNTFFSFFQKMAEKDSPQKQGDEEKCLTIIRDHRKRKKPMKPLTINIYGKGERRISIQFRNLLKSNPSLEAVKS